MPKLYYTPPSDTCFRELKAEAIKLWLTIGDKNYQKEKLDHVNKIENVSDNFVYIIAMFDYNNARKVIEKLSEPTKLALRERLIDGGQDENIIKRMGL